MMELRARLAEVTDLRNVKQLLEWDHQTMMPPDGSSTRAESVGTLERITHELFISDETGRLLEQTAEDLDGAAADSDDARIVEELFLATLSRFPDRGERQEALAHLRAAQDRRQAYVDLVWALINTREFILNH